MKIASFRRYPVKSMGGEYLDSIVIESRGIQGDRWFAVEDHAGHFASGKNTRRFRRRDQVFNYQASTDGAGSVFVQGAQERWRAGDPALDEHLSAAMGLPVNVTAEQEIPHQDGGEISLVGTASLAWCTENLQCDADPRRLRTNIVIETDEPFIEETWVGKTIQLGEAVLEIVERTERCRTIELAQDGLQESTRWLKNLAAERDMRLAVYARVLTPGRVKLSDDLVVRTLHNR